MWQLLHMISLLIVMGSQKRHTKCNEVLIISRDAHWELHNLDALLHLFLVNLAKIKNNLVCSIRMVRGWRYALGLKANKSRVQIKVDDWMSQCEPTSTARL